MILSMQETSANNSRHHARHHGGMAEWLCTWLLTSGRKTNVGSSPTASIRGGYGSAVSSALPQTEKQRRRTETGCQCKVKLTSGLFKHDTPTSLIKKQVYSDQIGTKNACLVQQQNSAVVLRRYRCDSGGRLHLTKSKLNRRRKKVRRTLTGNTYKR